MRPHEEVVASLKVSAINKSQTFQNSIEELVAQLRDRTDKTLKNNTLVDEFTLFRKKKIAKTLLDKQIFQTTELRQNQIDIAKLSNGNRLLKEELLKIYRQAKSFKAKQNHFKQ